MKDFPKEARREIGFALQAAHVLHCFKKKSTRGIKTPKHVIDVIEARLQRAEEDYQQWLKEREA